jgi:hypothetical protein
MQVQLNLQFVKLLLVNGAGGIKHDVAATVIFRKGYEIADTFTAAKNGA